MAHARNQGQRVAYWREEPLEVDAVIDGTWGAWAIEIKTGPIASADLAGLHEFTRRNPAAATWRSFLLEGLPGAARGH